MATSSGLVSDCSTIRFTVTARRIPRPVPLHPLRTRSVQTSRSPGKFSCGDLDYFRHIASTLLSQPGVIIASVFARSSGYAAFFASFVPARGILCCAFALHRFVRFERFSALFRESDVASGRAPCGVSHETPLLTSCPSSMFTVAEVRCLQQGIHAASPPEFGRASKCRLFVIKFSDRCPSNKDLWTPNRSALCPCSCVPGSDRFRASVVFYCRTLLAQRKYIARRVGLQLPC